MIQRRSTKRGREAEKEEKDVGRGRGEENVP